MRVILDVPDYSPEHGLRMQWEDGFTILTRIEDGTILIRANEEGFLSLARLLLALANAKVPPGDHWHLDEYNSLEVGSSEVIIKKL